MTVLHSCVDLPRFCVAPELAPPPPAPIPPPVRKGRAAGRGRIRRVKQKKRRKDRSAQPAPAAAPPLARAGRAPLGGRIALYLALTALIAAAPYLNTFRNAFVLDDIGIIVENPLVRDVSNVG